MLSRLLAFGVNLSRYQKRALLVVCDLLLLNFALWAAMSLRWGYLYLAPDMTIALLLAAVPLVAIASFFRSGVYRHVTRHFGIEGGQPIAVGTSLSGLGLGLGAFLLSIEGIPRSVLFTYPVIGTLLVWGYRRTIRWIAAAPARVTRTLPANTRLIQNVIIYGVGRSGLSLLEAIRRTHSFEVIGFVDPDPTLWRRYVEGVRVYAPDNLSRVIRSRDVRHVFLATHNASRKDRLQLLRWLEECPVEIRALPSMEDIAAGKISISDLRRVEAVDLLGRSPIPADPGLMRHAVSGKCVMVTGAGGSIGSELVRQILQHAPSRLVMLDASEDSLYEIDAEVKRLALGSGRSEQPEVISILGSVLNQSLVQNGLRAHEVQTLYHAAAFKHVPIVEQNVAVGLRNNTIATALLTEAAESCGVERFVLVSTDKAVRPASVMGASKRLAEMIVQARASSAARTVFAIVRFGNVLDSRGSVVRLFRRQIEAGGPVTVTHPDIVRYFISIPEAASLVIQAGAMAEGGEVFALDMGEPIRIVDLAKLMIRLSGLQVIDESHPNGDIEITFTGLRPGEKLVEDLHLAPRVQPTEHPRIVKAHEPLLPPRALDEVLNRLQSAVTDNRVEDMRRVLAESVEGFGGPVNFRDKLDRQRVLKINKGRLF